MTDTTTEPSDRPTRPLLWAVAALAAATVIVGVALATIDDDPPEAGPEIGLGRTCFVAEAAEFTDVAELVVIEVVDDTTALAFGRTPGDGTYPPLVEDMVLSFEGRTDAAVELDSTTADGADTLVERWVVGRDRLQRPTADYRRVDCAEITDRIGPVFDPAPLQIDTDQALPLDPERRVATASSTVGADQLDRFTVTVGAGEELTARITSIEDNATIGIVGPGRVPLVDADETTATVVAPVDGDYEVIVASTESLASYGLTVEVPTATG